MLTLRYLNIPVPIDRVKDYIEIFDLTGKKYTVAPRKSLEMMRLPSPSEQKQLGILCIIPQIDYATFLEPFQ